MNIDWHDESSHLLINPAYSEKSQLQFRKILDQASHDYPGHLWISTSGSSSLKWVGLSKQAVLNSAEAVNKHLKSTSEDVWVHALPDFHAGGIGIWARAYLSGSTVKKVHEQKWNAAKFYEFLVSCKGTLTSLVPAQLHDLIQLGYRGPSTLRAVIIGGGALPAKLYGKAVALGWKILPSYGSTEAASQIATAELGSWEKEGLPDLKILDHFTVLEEQGRLKLQGSSLLTAYAICNNDSVEFYDPKIDGFFTTEDRGRVQNGFVKIFGREDEVIKIGGESVDISRLESLLQNLIHDQNSLGEMTLIPVADERLSKVLHVVYAGMDVAAVEKLVTCFNQSVLPFEKIRHTHHVPSIPRSPLGKILKKELLLSL